MDFDTLVNENDPNSLDQWMVHCPLSPSAVKRPTPRSYSSGGSWHEGRVELKFENVIDDPTKHLIEVAILEAYQRLAQTIQGEGLYIRSYTQLTACIVKQIGNLSMSSNDEFECLGDSNEAICARIGTVLPITTGYAVYGRIENVQVMVQDPTAFVQTMDEMIDAKVALLRQATVSLGILERSRKEELDSLERDYQQKVGSFTRYHLDSLVALVCEQLSVQDRTEALSEWESQRLDILASWRYENKEGIMDIEHSYHCKRTNLLLGCRV